MFTFASLHPKPLLSLQLYIYQPLSSLNSLQPLNKRPERELRHRDGYENNRQSTIFLVDDYPAWARAEGSAHRHFDASHARLVLT